MTTALVILLLVLAIVIGVLTAFSPRHVPWVGLAVALVAAALLVSHLGLH